MRSRRFSAASRAPHSLVPDMMDRRAYQPAAAGVAAARTAGSGGGELEAAPLECRLEGVEKMGGVELAHLFCTSKAVMKTYTRRVDQQVTWATLLSRISPSSLSSAP